MEVICIECKKIFDVKASSLENGNKSSGLCLDCFIDWLKFFIEKLEGDGNDRNRLTFLKKLLTKKYIQRQEGG